MSSIDESIARAHAALALDGFEPLALGTADEVSWFEHELASLAEHRLGDVTDPRRLPAATRERWLERVHSERAYLPSDREYERCYWITERGERVGTVALSTMSYGGRGVRLASFYLLSEERGRGLGASVLRRIGAHLAAEGLGIQLDTSWCWNRAVRFYVRFGMWVRMWKRELSFSWSAGQLAPHVVIAGDAAELSVRLDGGVVPLVRARREGDRLSSMETLLPFDGKGDPRVEAVLWNADSTLALALALEGWPLVRSKKHWQERSYADAGSPESLAYKITVWEAWQARHGWASDAPRIQGLAYPTWAQLEARWKRESAKFERSAARRVPAASPASKKEKGSPKPATRKSVTKKSRA